MSAPPSGSAPPVPLVNDDEEDTAVVEPSDTSDRTEPQQPPTETPAVATAGRMGPPRTSKKTLVSPIPALLAEQMTKLIEGEPVDDVTPVRADARADATGRVSDREREALLRDDESDYVVELVDLAKASG